MTYHIDHACIQEITRKPRLELTEEDLELSTIISVKKLLDLVDHAYYLWQKSNHEC